MALEDGELGPRTIWHEARRRRRAQRERDGDPVGREVEITTPLRNHEGDVFVVGARAFCTSRDAGGLLNLVDRSSRARRRRSPLVYGVRRSSVRIVED